MVCDWVKFKRITSIWMSSEQSTTALESLVAMGFGEGESNEVRPPPRPSRHSPGYLFFGGRFWGGLVFVDCKWCDIGVCVVYADHGTLCGMCVNLDAVWG
jgi:hypothetical protein